MDVAESTSEAPALHLSTAEVTARRWQLLSVSVVVITIDQISKALAIGGLEDEPIEGPFGSALRLVYNRGSAFSLGEGFGPIFGVLALAVSIAMFFIVRQVHRRSVVFGLGLVQGGAIGNVLDRIFRDGDGPLGGAVIDFLEVGDWWPVFNLADAAIVIGGVIVALMGSRD